MDYIFNKYYFKTLHNYKSIEVPKKEINNLKLLSNNKLLCLNEGNIFIFDILNNQLLYKEEIIIDNEIFDKIELMDKDRFLLYNNRYILLFKFLEDKKSNIFKCIKLKKYKIYPQNEKTNIIYSNNKIIQINCCITLWKILKNNNFELQMNIESNLLRTSNRFIIVRTYPFLLNDEIIGFLRYLKFEFWNIKTYKYIYTTNELDINSFFSPPSIITIKNNIFIDDNNNLYVFSFVQKKIIKIIHIPYDKFNEGDRKIFYKAELNTIFLISKKNIYLFNYEKEKTYKINRRQSNFGKYCLITDNGDFILSSEYKIFFLKTSIIKTILFDILYFFGTFLYHLLFIRIFYGKKFKEISIIKYMILHYIPFLIYKNIEFPDSFEENVIKKKDYHYLSLILFNISFILSIILLLKIIFID